MWITLTKSRWYQVFFKSGWWFQRERLKCETLMDVQSTDDGRSVVSISLMTFIAGRNVFIFHNILSIKCLQFCCFHRSSVYFVYLGYPIWLSFKLIWDMFVDFGKTIQKELTDIIVSIEAKTLLPPKHWTSKVFFFYY